MPLPNCLRQPIRLWPRFPRGVASAGFGWVPAASDPQVNGMFPSIVSAQPAGVRWKRVSGNPVGDPAARSSEGMERRRRRREGSQVPPAERRGRRGAEDFPHEASRGRCRTRLGSHGHQTPGRTPPPADSESEPRSGIFRWLAPL